MSKKKAPTLPALVRKLDSIFSRYIRMKYADEGGTVSCVTCGKLMHWKEAHAGHFVSRRHMAVRWDERNVHPQCCGCNTFNGGALDEYASYIINIYGMNTFDELRGMKKLTQKWTRPELTELIAHFSNKVNELARGLAV
jgi:Bacteriophage Lambda NinG protein